MFHYQKIQLDVELQNLLMTFLQIQGVTMPGFTSPKDVISVIHELPYSLTKEIVADLLNLITGLQSEKQSTSNLNLLYVKSLKQMTSYVKTKTRLRELLLSVQETKICEFELDGTILGQQEQDAQRNLFTGLLRLKESGGSTPSYSQEIPLTISLDVERKCLHLKVT